MSNLNTILKHIEEKEKKNKEKINKEDSRKNKKQKKIKSKSINDLLEKSKGYEKFDPEDPLNENPEPCCKCEFFNGFNKRLKRAMIIFLVSLFILLFCGIIYGVNFKNN